MRRKPEMVQCEMFILLGEVEKIRKEKGDDSEGVGVRRKWDRKS